MARLIAVLFAGVFSFGSLRAQQFINDSTGTVTNHGTIRVKGDASGLRDSINGTFEYFGANQSVSATQYERLVVTGSGTKQSDIGAIAVTDSLRIGGSAAFAVRPGFTLELTGTMNELGTMQGKIRAVSDLTAVNGSSDFRGIGAAISWTSKGLNSTAVVRSSGTASTGNSTQSILRYIDVTPTVNDRLNASLVFKYNDSELNGQNANALELWRSTDAGSTWRRQGGTVNTSQHTITKSGVVQFSRWTAADTLHLLGPAQYEWQPDSVKYVQGNAQISARHASLNPFVVRLKDYFGNLLEGDTVHFAISGLAKGAVLSASNVATDSLGLASATLTLGDSLGTYTVVASNAKIPSRTVTFTSTASNAGSATIVSVVTGQNQPAQTILTAMQQFMVRTLDANGLPVAGVSVTFSISGSPTGATGQAITTGATTTDVNGRASTVLTLGNKVGLYTVRATSNGLTNSPISFNATAIAGAASVFAQVSGTSQVRQIGDTLPQPFIASLGDVGANPILNQWVKFVITGTPTSAVGQKLTADSVQTDSTGKAAVRLKLGNKAGTYTVVASSGGLAPLTFASKAFFLAGDANGDQGFNVADITSLVDHISGRTPLTGLNLLRADIDNNGVVDSADIAAIRGDILNATIVSDTVGSTPAPYTRQGFTQLYELEAEQADAVVGGVVGTLEVTANGLRFNLTNNVPVTGVQIHARFQNNVTIEAPERVFDRMKNMEVYVHSIGKDLRIVSYNLTNAPIDTGSGTLLRFPLVLTNVAQIDSVEVVLSTTNNQALVFAGVIAQAVPGVTYPTKYRLLQNYPNPFNNSTTIQFEIPDFAGRLAKVQIAVFNVLGEEVKTLYLGEKEAGTTHTVTWDGTDNRGNQMPSGLYFYRLIAREHVSAKKMILLK